MIKKCQCKVSVKKNTLQTIGKKNLPVSSSSVHLNFNYSVIHLYPLHPLQQRRMRIMTKHYPGMRIQIT